MSTNYYAKVIPSEPKKKELKELIDKGDFDKILHEINYVYERFEPKDDNEPIHGVIHLGNRAGGWKFLWNPNIYQIRNGHYSLKEGRFIVEPDTPYYTYPLTKKGIKEFIAREDVEVYDEYGKKQDKDEFFKMAVEWTTWTDPKTGKKVEAWDSDSYVEAYPNEHYYSCKNDYTDFLEAIGYKLSKYKSDFYSDGLRFSTYTDFC